MSYGAPACGSGPRVLADRERISPGRPGRSGRSGAKTSHGEPTGRLCEPLSAGIDGRSMFLMPSWRAWTIVTLAHWLPGLFDAVMARWGPSSYQDALAARGMPASCSCPERG